MNNAAPTRVLVIDDDAAMTEMLRLILEPNAFAVMVSHSGPQGIEAARSTDPEIIILDLAMPDMDGWEVCKAIRGFSQAPILVLSAISNPGMVAQALDEGADDFLLKPMTSSVLIAHLKRLVWRARGGSGTSSGTSSLNGHKATKKLTDSPSSAVAPPTGALRVGDEFGALHAAPPEGKPDNALTQPGGPKRGEVQDIPPKRTGKLS